MDIPHSKTDQPHVPVVWLESHHAEHGPMEGDPGVPHVHLVPHREQHQGGGGRLPAEPRDLVLGVRCAGVLV